MTTTHYRENSQLNIIMAKFPKIYKLIKAEALLQDCPVHFDRCADINEALSWATTTQGHEFWEDMSGLMHRAAVIDCYARDVDRFLGKFGDKYASLFNNGPVVFINHYSQHIDPNTGLEAGSDGFGVDFTTKRRLCDY